jgi:nucleotide-binding universal stress UspA family protein
MYKKILVPLDGSKRAEHILSHVENIARPHSAEVILLQVVTLPVLSDGYKSILLDETRRKSLRIFEESLAYLRSVERKFQKKGIRTHKFCENGPVVDSMLKVAQREDVDLIAIASHGRRGLSRVFYGSVAAAILQSVDRPLLLVRSRKAL